MDQDGTQSVHDGTKRGPKLEKVSKMVAKMEPKSMNMSSKSDYKNSSISRRRFYMIFSDFGSIFSKFVAYICWFVSKT